MKLGWNDDGKRSTGSMFLNEVLNNTEKTIKNKLKTTIKRNLRNFQTENTLELSFGASATIEDDSRWSISTVLLEAVQDFFKHFIENRELKRL